MTSSDSGAYCDAQTLSSLLRAVKAQEVDVVHQLTQWIARWPGDARLLFLRGSVFGSQRSYPEALLDLRRAVSLDTHYVVARFQLGLLEMTCGEVQQAEQTWHPLMALPREDALAMFAQGLVALAGNQFDRARRLLLAGMSLNDAQPAINVDMQRVLERMQGTLARTTHDPDPPVARHLLLAEYLTDNETKH